MACLLGVQRSFQKAEVALLEVAGWTLDDNTIRLGDGAKGVFGVGVEAEAALDRGQKRLLEDGYWGVAEWVGELAVRMPAGGDGAALGAMLNDFAGHQGRLNYVLRLRRG